MKAPAFRYCSPETVDEALEVLERFGDEARILAGGQSLIPSLNMRLSSPSVLVDINRVSDLAGISESKNGLAIGSLARHSEIEHSPLVERHAPLLRMGISHVAHHAIRNRGTFGGSVALADPAAELPALAVALGGVLTLRSKRGERRVPADQFFRGLYETELAADELIVGADFPVRALNEQFAFREFARRHGDFAVAGIVVRAEMNGTETETIRIVLFGVADRPILASHASGVLTGQLIDATSISAAQDALKSDVTPMGDTHHDSDTKMHLLRVLLKRSLLDLQYDD